MSFDKVVKIMVFIVLVPLGTPASWGVVVMKDFLEEEALKQGSRLTRTHCCPHSDQELCVSNPGPLISFSMKDRLVPKDFWLDLELTMLVRYLCLSHLGL